MRLHLSLLALASAAAATPAVGWAKYWQSYFAEHVAKCSDETFQGVYQGVNSDGHLTVEGSPSKPTVQAFRGVADGAGNFQLQVLNAFDPGGDPGDPVHTKYKIDDHCVGEFHFPEDKPAPPGAEAKFYMDSSGWFYQSFGFGGMPKPPLGSELRAGLREHVSSHPQHCSAASLNGVFTGSETAYMERPDGGWNPLAGILKLVLDGKGNFLRFVTAAPAGGDRAEEDRKIGTYTCSHDCICRFFTHETGKVPVGAFFAANEAFWRQKEEAGAFWRLDGIRLDTRLPGQPKIIGATTLWQNGV